jgi:hypothetical protein
MAPRCSIPFGVREAILGVVQRLLEISNSLVERADVALRGEIQRTRDPLHPPIDRAFHATAQTEAFHHESLSPRVLNELRHPRILQELDKTMSKSAHRVSRGEPSQLPVCRSCAK